MPLTKYEDLKGLKIRVMQSPVWIDTFKAMGISATHRWPMPRSTRIKTVLDGLEHPPVDMYQSKFMKSRKTWLSLLRVYAGSTGGFQQAVLGVAQPTNRPLFARQRTSRVISSGRKRLAGDRGS